jgi:FMN phosphatase YigB (HAD superfamily)
MVGDNLEWDIAGAQRLGIRAAYIDRKAAGLADSGVRPDRVLSSLLELVGQDG